VLHVIGEKNMENEKNKTTRKEYIEVWESHIDDFNRLFWHTNDMQKRGVKSAQDILRTIVKEIAERDFKED
jgi:hypothetical protein